jgi:hypothetical protein
MSIAATLQEVLDIPVPNRDAANDSNTLFGTSVALAPDDNVICGVPTKYISTATCGAVYVFSWGGSLIQEIVPDVPDRVGDAAFGHAVAVSGNWLFIGVPGVDLVYIYKWNGSTYVFNSKTAGTTTASGDEFGWSVTVDGATAAVGARLDDNAAADAGVVFVFTEAADVWSEAQIIPAPVAQADQYFGHKVALDETSGVLAISANQFNSAFTNEGRVYLYEWTGALYALGGSGTLSPSGAVAGGFFGDSLGVTGLIVAVGSPGEDIGASNAGAVYLYRKSGTWSESQVIRPQDPQNANTALGWAQLTHNALQLSGEYLLAGARGYEQLAATDVDLEGGTWVNHSPMITEPLGRRMHGMCYDPERIEIVMYGGRDSTNTIIDETWGFKNGLWTQKLPVNTPKGYLAVATGLEKIDLIWDPRNRVVLLFGGTTNGLGSGQVNALFSWNGVNWSQEIAHGAGGNPPARDNFGWAFDEERDQIVVFSGDRGGGPQQETWLCDVVVAAAGSRYTWQVQASPATEPSAREGHRMGYNPKTKTVFMIGGSAGQSDTWEWTGTNWVERSPSPSYDMTSASWPQPMFMYIPAIDEFVILGRDSGIAGAGRMYVYKWNATTPAWEIIDLRPAWTYDGTNFQEGPPFPRYGAAGAYNSDEDVLMMFGGKSSLVAGAAHQETWTIQKLLGGAFLYKDNGSQFVFEGLIYPEVLAEFGSAVALNPDANRIAIGGYQEDRTNTPAIDGGGTARLYAWFSSKVGSIIDIKNIAHDVLRVQFSEPVATDEDLTNLNNWSIAVSSAGSSDIAIKEVRGFDPDDPVVSFVDLHVSKGSIYGDYTLSVTGLKNASEETLGLATTPGILSKEFVSRLTKTDSYIKFLSNFYNLQVSSNVRSIITAMAIEDEDIGGETIE